METATGDRVNKRTRGQGHTPDFPRLLGGALALDFVNTVEAPISESPTEFLTSYVDVARWCHHSGALDEQQVDGLVRAGARKPNDADAVFERVLELRAAADAAFRRVAASKQPRRRDLLIIEHEYLDALCNARLVPARRGCHWRWDHRSSDLAIPLWRLVGGVVDLLLAGELSRIKLCPGAGDCGWLFYDTSRHGRRRWCSMEGCGSRVKMRRHYARQKGRKPSL
ncbi:MAG: CGNR zinc finger domain-containing protein [Actinomycetota bacterium]|nr:CGNR zinc finger domain-containing protein [Actinomycetota bacterium]